MPKLTQAQIRFLILKGIHLLAVLVIFFILFCYFNKYSNENVEIKNEDEVVKTTTYVNSAYEIFCRNNNDINCGTVQSFFSEANTKSQVVLMDTEEIGAEVRKQIFQVVTQGTEVQVQPEDMHQLLDKLYEEELPDDIIEPVKISNDKMRGLQIIPERKPPYFGKEPVVVIVIDDMGISRKRTADIASLRGPITASFLTYGRNLDEQIQNSLKNGQEIMIHVPMEAKTSIDVAPDVLTTQMSKEEIKNNLSAMIKKFKNVKGINNHMGSKLTEDYDRMIAVMEVLKDNGLYFLDSKTSPNSKAENAAINVGIAYAHRHVFLDNNNDKAYILGQLAKVESLANKNGYAIAIGHPKTQTYEALKEWLLTVDKKGIKIVPLSYVIEILHPTMSASK